MNLDTKLPIVDKSIILEAFHDSSTKIPIQNLYSQGPVILFCLRSASCFMCRRMTKLMMDNKHRFEKYGVRMYCILKERIGAQDYINQYWNDPETVLIDPQFDLHRIIGYCCLIRDGKGDFRVMSLQSVFNVKMWGNVVQAVQDGHQWGGNFWSQNTILGGSVLVSTIGEIVYQTIEQNPGDLPDVEGLVEASKALHYQEFAEDDYKTALSPDNLLSLGIDFSKVG